MERRSDGKNVKIIGTAFQENRTHIGNTNNGERERERALGPYGSRASTFNFATTHGFVHLFQDYQT